MESIFDILLIPMGWILRVAYQLTNNYLLAIMLFTLVMEILLLPLGIKQQKNQVKQASLAPKVMAIKKKYAGRNDRVTQQKIQTETMELYQKENFNPAGGCGTLLIQLPIIMALFSVVTNPLRYICGLKSTEIDALTKAIGNNLTGTSGYPQYNLINFLNKNGVKQYTSIVPDLEKTTLPDFTVFGIDLSNNPSFNPFNWLIIIPILTFVVMIVSQKIMQRFTYQSPESKEAQNNMSMKIMTWSMPLLSVWFEFQMPAIIGVYWVFRNILSTVQRIILSKMIPVPQFTEEDYKEAERQANMSKRQKKREAKEGEKKFVRSLHFIDDEEYLARHAEDLKELSGETDVDNAVGNTTEAAHDPNSKMAPAPIKNDEKTRYKSKNKSENKSDNTKN